jgi:hypothetical protein
VLPPDAESWFALNDVENVLVAVVCRTVRVKWGNYEDILNTLYDLVILRWDKSAGRLDDTIRHFLKLPRCASAVMSVQKLILLGAAERAGVNVRVGVTVTKWRCLSARRAAASTLSGSRLMKALSGAAAAHRVSSASASASAVRSPVRILSTASLTPNSENATTKFLFCVSKPSSMLFLIKPRNH